MQLFLDLEKRTPAQFVGEPTGASPNHYGDARQLVLPEARLVANVATVSWTTAGEGDDRLALEPDLPVPVRSTDYFAGRDPALEAALDSVRTRSGSTTRLRLKRTLSDSGQVASIPTPAPRDEARACRRPFGSVRTGTGLAVLETTGAAGIEPNVSS